MRRFLSFLPSSNCNISPKRNTEDSKNRIALALDTLIPENPNLPYDMKELIVTISDQNDFFELQENYAKNILIGFIRLDGQTIGLVANQPMVLAGCLDIDSSRKAARFVRFCDAFNIPILTLVDVKTIHQTQVCLGTYYLKYLHIFLLAYVNSLKIVSNLANHIYL